MKIFQNKFFIICLCIALVLTIVPSVFAIMGYRSLAKNIVGTITMPVRWVATVVTDSIAGWGKYFGNMKALNQENEALIEENAALKEQLQNVELLEKENERFSKGDEKGHFELAGSTIILLFEKDTIQLDPTLLEKLSLNEEVQVKLGECIGTAKIFEK